MKKMLKVLLVLMTVVSIAGCSSKTTTEKATKKTKTLSGNYQVEIKVKDYGTIYAEIDADTAPITVTNFVKLSKEKFYDGVISMHAHLGNEHVCMYIFIYARSGESLYLSIL